MPKRPVRTESVVAMSKELTELAARAKGRPTCVHNDQLSQIWHADALSLLATLASNTVDLVIADPPYAIGKADWDHFASMDLYTQWCDQWLAEVHRVLTPQGTAYICGFSEILAEIKVRSAKRFAGCKWLVWYYKNKANLGQDWGRSHESILHLRKGKGGLVDVDSVRIPYNTHTTKYPDRVQAESSQYARSGKRDNWRPHPLGAKPRDVFEIPVICNGMAEKQAHPTQKPLELIEKFVLASSSKGDLVVDPFSGSGTTAAAALKHGRRYIVGDRDIASVQMTLDRCRKPLGPPKARNKQKR